MIKTQTSPREHTKAKWAPILAVLASMILGGLAGVGPSLAMFSDQVQTNAQVLTAGNLDLILDTTRTWSLNTPGSIDYPSETITGGPTDTDIMEGLWMTNDTDLHVHYSGEFSLVGDNLIAELAVTPMTDVLAHTPGDGIWSVVVKNSSGTEVLDITRLTQGNYTFIVTFCTQGEGFTSPLIGGEAEDWTFSLASPIVKLKQVRP